MILIIANLSCKPIFILHIREQLYPTGDSETMARLDRFSKKNKEPFLTSHGNFNSRVRMGIYHLIQFDSDTITVYGHCLTNVSRIETH